MSTQHGQYLLFSPALKISTVEKYISITEKDDFKPIPLNTFQLDKLYFIMIDQIKRYPAIWDDADEKYDKNSEEINKAWNDAWLGTYKVSGHVMTRKRFEGAWEFMKGSYAFYRDRLQKKGMIQWQFYDALGYLEKVMEKKENQQKEGTKVSNTFTATTTKPTNLAVVGKIPVFQIQRSKTDEMSRKRARLETLYVTEEEKMKDQITKFMQTPHILKEFAEKELEFLSFINENANAKPITSAVIKEWENVVGSFGGEVKKEEPKLEPMEISRSSTSEMPADKAKMPKLVPNIGFSMEQLLKSPSPKPTSSPSISANAHANQASPTKQETLSTSSPTSVIKQNFFCKVPTPPVSAQKATSPSKPGTEQNLPSMTQNNDEKDYVTWCNLFREKLESLMLHLKDKPREFEDMKRDFTRLLWDRI